jgi:Mg2+ and Co2+ transporter CorA
LITIFKHQAGKTTCVEQVDAAWLDPASGIVLWVDLTAPKPEETKILSDVFHFHPLSIEDAVSDIHHPKIESFTE